MEDTESITRVLHKGGALAFWDYATAAPYVEIDMNPKGLSASDSVSSVGRPSHLWSLILVGVWQNNLVCLQVLVPYT